MTETVLTAELAQTVADALRGGDFSGWVAAETLAERLRGEERAASEKAAAEKLAAEQAVELEALGGTEAAERGWLALRAHNPNTDASTGSKPVTCFADLPHKLKVNYATFTQGVLAEPVKGPRVFGLGSTEPAGVTVVQRRESLWYKTENGKWSTTKGRQGAFVLWSDLVESDAVTEVLPEPEPMNPAGPRVFASLAEVPEGVEFKAEGLEFVKVGAEARCKLFDCFHGALWFGSTAAFTEVLPEVAAEPDAPKEPRKFNRGDVIPDDVKKVRTANGSLFWRGANGEFTINLTRAGYLPADTGAEGHGGDEWFKDEFPITEVLDY
ncbi:hypothetical protein CH253_08380 [Rhodococcus sp. 06-156-3C]|uniref:hypothetical protein n=1 Tax=Rhodococcus sp. 06-156-3C TaxID=2022486 RepID=UPI000B9C55FF|nr:hypothetical protein [Rhodococcus sp. 06-156-3C]OZD23863.1 hypothetical protein CH253_08380 [Rhodococcus sp. 06-156-3C]